MNPKMIDVEFPFTWIEAMFNASIKMTVSQENHKEVLQVLKELLGPIRLEKGCISCHCYADVESENRFFFREEWRSGEDLGAHLESAHFGVLIGAIKLLTKDPDFRFNTVLSTVETKEFDDVIAARKKPGYF